MSSPRDDRTIEQRLATAGYGHRRDARTENTGEHVVYRLDTGEVVGRFRACEALQLLEETEFNRIA